MANNEASTDDTDWSLNSNKLNAPGVASDHQLTELKLTGFSTNNVQYLSKDYPMLRTLSMKSSLIHKDMNRDE